MNYIDEKQTKELKEMMRGKERNQKKKENIYGRFS